MSDTLPGCMIGPSEPCDAFQALLRDLDRVTAERDDARDKLRSWEYSAKHDDEHFKAMKARAEAAEKDAGRLHDLMALVPVSPKAISYDQRWLIIDAAQEIANELAAIAQGEK